MRSFVWRVCVECVLVLYAELCGAVWERVPSVREGETGVGLMLYLRCRVGLCVEREPSVREGETVVLLLRYVRGVCALCTGG